MWVLKMIQRAALVMLMTVAMAHSAQKDQIAWHNVDVVIRGDYFRASTVAYNDFAKRLAVAAKETATSAVDSNSELQEYLVSIEHYNIQVGFGRNQYLVWMLPRTSDEFPAIFGGDALYIIDAKEFKILEKHFGK